MNLTYLIVVFTGILANVPITSGNSDMSSLAQSAKGRRRFSATAAREDLSRNPGLLGELTGDTTTEKSPPTGDFIRALIEDNEDVWKRLVNHPFCLLMGNGSASLDRFKEYMIQDFLHLQNDIQFLLQLYSKTEDWSTLNTEASEIIARAFKLAKHHLDVCTKDLQIPEASILTTLPTRQLKEHIDFKHKALDTESWIGCVEVAQGRLS
ncbi:hypothetical protein FRC12_021013 [Ceratobasidium sp. 428]|nr:hypothetical protein FRC12_021013 [Ceratobasidium sp. 428]